jgi:2'-5' RNA ligase
MNSAPYNIVLELPPRAKNTPIKLSKQFRKRGGIFTLARASFVPHITIYLTDFPKRNEKKIIAKLRKVTEGTKPILCKPLHYRKVKGGYVDILYHKTKSMSDLQKAVIAAINPLREKYATQLAGLSATRKRNAKRFGFTDIGTTYHPHVTLSRFTEGKEALPKHMPISSFSFEAISIGFYHRGEHGTCRKLIARFPLVG